jgi:hypothetical protein
MKLISKILFKLISKIEGVDILGGKNNQIITSVGFCNVYSTKFKAKKTSGYVMSSMPYKTKSLALSSKSEETVSDYIGTFQIYKKEI